MVYENEAALLVLEYANKGDLSEAITKAADKNQRLRAKELFQLAMIAVNELHLNQIAHRDIKTANFLLRRTRQGISLKIADFGFSTYAPTGLAARSKVGTICFMAPEVYDYDSEKVSKNHLSVNYDPFKADIFSAGLVLFSLITNDSLFVSPSLEDDRFVMLKTHGFIGYINHYHIKNLFMVNGRLDYLAIILLDNMLKLDPEARPTAQEVLADPWLKKAYHQPS